VPWLTGGCAALYGHPVEFPVPTPFLSMAKVSVFSLPVMVVHPFAGGMLSGERMMIFYFFCSLAGASPKE